jgi:hypothetical protein
MGLNAARLLKITGRLKAMGRPAAAPGRAKGPAAKSRSSR